MKNKKKQSLTYFRAYNEIDGIPAAVHPLLYRSLREWEFDGIVIADDLCKSSTNITLPVFANLLRHEKSHNTAFCG